MTTKTTIHVAVYWPGEASYGIGNKCATMEEADRRAAEDAALGYNKPGKSEIHIIETTRTVTKWKPPL